MTRTDQLSTNTVHLVRDACFCLHVQRAGRALARRYDEALRSVALTNGQFSLLMSLHRDVAPTIGEVSSLLAMDRTTLTANLKPLERRGLLKVTVDADDKRSRRVLLLPAGRKLLIDALPAWRRVQASTERRIKSADSKRFLAELMALS